MSAPTLLEVVRLNGADAAVGLIEEASKAHPEVRIGAARTIKGLNYKTNVRTAIPTINFRDVNEGTAVAGSTFEQRLVECFLMNPPFECDKAAADAHEDGAAVYMAIEALGITEGAMQALAAAFYYGTDSTYGKSKGFPGLLQCYDSTNMVVDAGGTTASTGSSCWLVRFGLQDVNWIMGEGGRADVSEVQEVRLTDSSGNPYDGYYQSLYMRPGLQVGSVYSVCRIKKLTEDSGKTLSDTLLDKACEKFPAGKPPNAIFCTRRSLRQLKNSRTATNPTGAPAPWPTSIQGPEGDIPILVTDSISNVEALTL